MNYVDTSEDSFVETLPSPAFTFPQTQQTLVPGKTSALLSFDIMTGMPAIVHGFTVTIAGPLFDGATPLFSNLHVVDENGNSISGIQQLPSRRNINLPIFYAQVIAVNQQCRRG